MSADLIHLYQSHEQKYFVAIPVDTGRKLNVHETFRRRPGRLLKVLYTFNLRPVSTGIAIQVECVSHQVLFCFFSFTWANRKLCFQLWAGAWGACDLLWCISICYNHSLITLVKFEQFQRQMFVQFIFVLAVFKETHSHFVRNFSRIPFK